MMWPCRDNQCKFYFYKSVPVDSSEYVVWVFFFEGEE